MNAYNVLGIKPGASADDIKGAYRKLAKEHHPDRHGGSDEAKKKFQEIQSAYDMLRNDKSKSQGEAHPYAGAGTVDLHAMFEQMFRQHQFHQSQMHATYHAFAEITLRQAFDGCQVSFNLPNGKTFVLDIPKGVAEGQMFTIQGVADDNGKAVGTLQVVVRIQPSPDYARRGLDLMCKVEVDLIDSLVGCTKEVTNIDGEKISVTIPPNSTPQSSVTITGKGMPVPGTENRGNLQVFLNIEFRHFDEKEIKILKRLQKKA